MSNYIPRYRKKRDVLAKREQELIRLLKQGASHEQVVAAAEEVRAAQIRVYNAERARVPASSTYHAQLADIEARYRRWSFMTAEEIIAMYHKHTKDA